MSPAGQELASSRRKGLRMAASADSSCPCKGGKLGTAKAYNYEQLITWGQLPVGGLNLACAAAPVVASQTRVAGVGSGVLSTVTAQLI